MEDNKDILLSLTKWLFILVSVAFVIYSTITMRGMYFDGSYYFLRNLSNFENHYYLGVYDPTRIRHAIMFIQQFPLIFSHNILQINNKTALIMIYSCTQFLLPLMVLYFNYRLTKRTKRTDIFFWSLLNYSLILLLFSVFSVSEMLIGTTLHFILWNYLASKIDYKKYDIAFIILLILIMFLTWEYVIFLGPIFFAASIMYAKREDNIYNKKIKNIIGIGALIATIVDVILLIRIMIKFPGNGLYFIKETYDFIPYLFNLCSILSITAIVFLLITLLINKKISCIFYFLMLLIYSSVLAKLLCTLNVSLIPMWEGHMRSIEFLFIPCIFFFIYIFDLLGGQYNQIKIRNYFIVVLLCGIFQTIWQCVHTYYWDINIKYMKNELKNCKELLYIPSEHDEISSFLNPNLRRYIWWGNYAAMSIIFSDEHEIKTLLVNYDDKNDEGNRTFRDRLYVIPEKNLISIPYDILTQTKNKFWDLTKVADALYKYNLEHNIETDYSIKTSK